MNRFDAAADEMLESGNWFLLQVPINTQGEWDLDHGDDENNLKIFELTRQQCDAVFPLFQDWNDEFGIFIGYEETARITKGNVRRALSMAQAEMGRAGDPVLRDGLAVVIAALTYAKASSTCVEITLGL